MNIRDIIKERSAILRHPDTLSPHTVADTLVELTSLLATLNTEVVSSQHTYSKKRLELRKENKSAADTRIAAEASDEWLAWQERLGQSQALVELIRSLKRYLEVAHDERKLG